MDSTLINDFLKKLATAIAFGNDQEAAEFAKQLATLQIECLIQLHHPKNDNLINIQLYIEDRLTHKGPIQFQLPLLMTVAQLKEKMASVFHIPPDLQHWTMNNITVTNNNNTTLKDLNLTDGSVIFLYIVAPNLDIINSAKRRRFCSDNENEIDCAWNGYEILPISPNHVHHNRRDEAIEISDDKVELPEVVQMKEPEKTLQVLENIDEAQTDESEVDLEHNEVLDVIIEPADTSVEDNQLDEYTNLMNLESYDVVPNDDFATCPICLNTYGPFETIRLRECLHAFCRECLENTIKFCENSEVKCPYVDDYTCQATIQHREIKALVNSEIYEAHLAKSISQAESRAGQYAFHCKTPNCTQWILHDNERNHFTCPSCEKTNCLKCKVIHEGKTCVEYTDGARLSEESKLTDATLNSMLVSGTAMNCPVCGVIITKTEGCDAVQCAFCKTDICWVTRGRRWGPGGYGDTSGGCKCKVNGRQCHPNCQNCH